MLHSKSLALIAGAAALVLAAVAIAGCGGGGSSEARASAPKTADGRSATLGVADESLGDILVDSRGRTLYLFEKDSGTTSSCTGACAVNWPPLRSGAKPTTGNGVDASLIGTTGRSDGEAQVTYNGHPLYLFAGDQQPGDANGQGVDAFGGLWYVLSPSGDEITSSRGSGGGYGY